MASNVKKWVMVVDLDKCVGCQSCTVSCKFENPVPEGFFRTRVTDVEIGTYPETRRSFLPQLCNQCENAPCIPVCPVKATYRQPEGVVVIDPTVCIGCGACIQACPYGARYLNPISKKADKCDFCLSRVSEFLLPACVETCVGNARIFGDLSDPESDVAKMVATRQVKVLKPEAGTKPQVFYVGLSEGTKPNAG